MNPKHEIAYRLRTWTAGKNVRRSGIIFVTMAAMLHAGVLMLDFIIGGQVLQRLPDHLPTVLVTAVGLCCVWLGWTPREWVVRHWNLIATAGLSLIAGPVVVLYVPRARPCQRTTHVR